VADLASCFGEPADRFESRQAEITGRHSNRQIAQIASKLLDVTLSQI
jgi:hypothetical protein